MRRYALRDDQWEKIETGLPSREGTIGRPEKTNRLFVETVILADKASIVSMRMRATRNQTLPSHDAL